MASNDVQTINTTYGVEFSAVQWFSINNQYHLFDVINLRIEREGILKDDL